MSNNRLNSIDSTIQADLITWSCPCGVSLEIEFQISEHGVGYADNETNAMVTGGVSVPCHKCGRRFFLPCMANFPSVAEVISEK